MLWRSVWFGLVSVEFHFVFFFLCFSFLGVLVGVLPSEIHYQQYGRGGVYGVCCTKFWRGFSRRGALCQRTRLYYFPGVFSRLFTWSGSTVLNTLRLKFNNWVPIKGVFISH